MKISRAIITMTGCAAVAALALTTPAFAGDKGKAAGGCSNPYQLAYYHLDTGELTLGSPSGPYEQHADAGLNADPPVFSTDGASGTLNVDDLYLFLDHNNDGALCVKQPSGWTEPNNGNNRAAFYINLTDDKAP